jgi:hypothetical protein
MGGVDATTLSQTMTLLAVERSDGGPARSQIRSRRRRWQPRNMKTVDQSARPWGAAASSDATQ